MLPDNYLYIICVALAALVTAVMWIDYFRTIDVFESEHLGNLIIALLVGCITPFISLFFYYLLSLFDFDTNGEVVNDLLYTIFGIGLNEEISKIIGVAIAFQLLKSKINEPIDYLIYAGVVALGFAMVENYSYFNNYGIQIISSRAFYSVLEHVINTSIIVYGFYRTQLFKKGNRFQNTFVALALAASSHGLFDFFLINDSLGFFAPFVSTIIYLVGINFWVQMLNNANNFSHVFEYQKIHRSEKVFFRLLYWYLLTLLIAFVFTSVTKDISTAVTHMFVGIITGGLLLIVVILRVSRFKIYKQKYFEVKLQLPFYFTKNNDEDFRLFGAFPLKIRGENSFEYALTSHIHREIIINPLNPKKSHIGKPLKAIIVDKVLLVDDVVIYLVKVFFDEKEAFYMLKPKTAGITLVNEKHAISGLLKIEGQVNLSQSYSQIPYKNFKLIEWIYIKNEN